MPSQQAELQLGFLIPSNIKRVHVYFDKADS